jgi:hypothetical protein
MFITVNVRSACRTVLSAATATFLCGCPGVILAQPLAQPEREKVQGPYVHTGSGIVMPESVGNFERGFVTRFNQEATDISAGYNLFAPSNHIVITVYVYPAPKLTSIGSPPDVIAGAQTHLAEQEFDRRQQEIMHAHPKATLMDQHDTDHIENTHSFPGKTATYEFEGIFAGSSQSLRSLLYVFCYVNGKWAIEYRVTFPKAEDDDGEVQNFIHQWNWYPASDAGK